MNRPVLKAIGTIMAIPTVVITAVLLGICSPFIYLGLRIYTNHLDNKPHNPTVIEDFGDTILCKCSCGETFISSPCGEENCKEARRGHRLVLVPCCPKEPRV